MPDRAEIALIAGNNGRAEVGMAERGTGRSSSIAGLGENMSGDITKVNRNIEN